MERYTKEELSAAFSRLGLEKGDIVFFQSRLHGLGIPEGVDIKSREELCSFFLEALFDVLGESGTVALMTATTQVARHDLEYDVDNTESNYGVLANYAVKHPGFVRTWHPILSYVAMGERKDEICRIRCGNSCGAGSPLDMLYRLKGKNILLGLEPSDSLQIVHYIEAAYGVPYVYNKLLKWKPTVGGQKQDKDFVATVRYLEYDIKRDLTRFQKDLEASNLIRSTVVGGGNVLCLDIDKVVEFGWDRLDENLFYFLETPPNFVYGKIPFDGPSAEREEKHRGEQGFTHNM